MQFCPQCGSIMNPDTDQEALWICDSCDFGVKIEGVSEEEFVSTESQDEQTRKGVSTRNQLDDHPKAPENCPVCNARTIQLRVEMRRSRGKTTRRFVVHCRSCDHEEQFHKESEYEVGAPEKCPSCESNKLTIERNIEPEYKSQEYNGRAHCRECENTSYFQVE